MEFPSFAFLNLIAQTIYDKKGFNILVIDLRGVSTLADYFVIAEGNIDRHIAAIADELLDVLKKEGEEVVFTEGLRGVGSGWIVLDYLHTIIHLFTPELRGKYALEEVWKDGKIVDTVIDIKTHLVEMTRENPY